MTNVIICRQPMCFICVIDLQTKSFTMETLTAPKTGYILEARLDLLHSESKEWLSEVEFFKSELRFFMKLLKSKVFTLKKEHQRQHIFENMDRLSSSVVREVEKEIKAHEKQLSELMGGKRSDDERYRQVHKSLLEKIKQLDNDIRTLKMLVFDFVEHLK